jgi:tRNA(Arg) A34 adenosine deaminase TadA
MSPDEFMARAIELGRAGLHTKDGRPFAAVIVKEGTIVGEGRRERQ